MRNTIKFIINPGKLGLILAAVSYSSTAWMMPKFSHGFFCIELKQHPLFFGFEKVSSIWCLYCKRTFSKMVFYMEKTKSSQTLTFSWSWENLFEKVKKKFKDAFHELKCTTLKKKKKQKKNKKKKSSFCSWHIKANSSYRARKKEQKKWRNDWNNCYFYSRWKKVCFNLNSQNKSNHKTKKRTNSKIEARNFKNAKCWELKKRFFTRTNIKWRKLLFWVIKFDHSGKTVKNATLSWE